MISKADKSKPKTADMPYFVIQILWNPCIQFGKPLLIGIKYLFILSVSAHTIYRYPPSIGTDMTIWPMCPGTEITMDQSVPGPKLQRTEVFRG